MQINRVLLEKAVQQHLISSEQSEQLWQFLNAQMKDTPSFRFTHILYYLGGLLGIGAMTLFMTLGWERFGGWGLVAISVAYAVAGLVFTDYLFKRKLLIPAGLCGAFVVALTPLAIYGLQSAMGFWAEGRHYQDYYSFVDWRWIWMELGTLAAGAIMLYLYRLPFMVMPIAVTLWYLSMDLALFLSENNDIHWELRKLVSIWFGVCTILLAVWVDLRSKHEKDFPFWLYLFGVITFWTGLTMMESGSELNKFIYLCINLLMIGIGAILSRRVFVVFGGLGVASYTTHLAYDVFKDSMAFPFALTFIGLVIVYSGILWQKHEEDISTRLRSLLPICMQDLINRRAAF
ncbi:hypothetical protein [Methylophilus sp. Leaf408]|uniref:hypothetical protein n=1 Tax=Methylophilus sp. Leaf408 TaxID=2876561 RepID=UPI001E2A2A4F|nr:hypothetical protein [Methylophilus sp. Leaf408]